ncbi:glutaredoxin-like protein (plasmid) [Variovorax sp. SRS16]|uniref:glutaredoxin domain-containing protein n=1 Tax=Variovorax sp. SRS16 TaxID=282217 RepID=UPI0013192D0D|nr:glutaredoxin domain-containing protein [Variovorax sp. SRS16]VTU45621.1 glutaredoxin-like protein [Variovorax sp. SRS16]
MSLPTQQPAHIKVFWQPGCSSCLRTKEFLTKQGVEYESVNVQDNAEALAELRRLGARGLPVVSLGDRFTLCQSFGDVLKFLDLKTRLGDPLPPAQLFEKIELVLTAAARYTRQFPETQLKEVFRNRNTRTQGATAFHVFRVVEMFIDAVEGAGLHVEGFRDVPRPEWTGKDIADWGLKVRDRALAWWNAQTDRELKYTVQTYYGQRPVHDVLDRTSWHAAQHTRQLILMLESAGIQVDRPLTADDLRGLPVPDEVWG